LILLFFITGHPPTCEGLDFLSQSQYGHGTPLWVTRWRLGNAPVGDEVTATNRLRWWRGDGTGAPLWVTATARLRWWRLRYFF